MNSKYYDEFCLKYKKKMNKILLWIIFLADIVWLDNNKVVKMDSDNPLGVSNSEFAQIESYQHEIKEIFEK